MPLEYDPENPPRNYDGSIMTIPQFNQAMRDLERRRAAHHRYRQTEKYKEKRKEYDKERRKRRAQLLSKAREYLNQDKPKFEPRELTERQKELKRQYNNDRYHRLKLRREAIRRQAVQEKIKSGEWGNLPYLITKDSPPEDSSYHPSARLATEEEAAEFHKIRAKSAVERLPEDEQEIIVSEHEAWYAVRGEFERIVHSARREARPVSNDEISSFRFQPVHHPMDRFPDRCGYCGCTFKTPVGNRNVSQRPEWDDSPYNCTVIMDIPDDVFWPGKK